MSDIQKEYVSKGVAVLGCTIDPTGMAALQDFVTRFHPGFAIGALDQETVNSFGQWGPRRPFVPQVYLIDKAGNVQGQFMGSDGFFEGDKMGNVRAALDHLIGANGPSKPVVKKK